MDGTYRMLGKEHEADLEREAQQWGRAAEVRGQRSAVVPVPHIQVRGTPGAFSARRFIAFLARVARAES
jgi:hypothetical protein